MSKGPIVTHINRYKVPVIISHPPRAVSPNKYTPPNCVHYTMEQLMGMIVEAQQKGFKVGVKVSTKYGMKGEITGFRSPENGIDTYSKLPSIVKVYNPDNKYASDWALNELELL